MNRRVFAKLFGPTLLGCTFFSNAQGNSHGHGHDKEGGDHGHGKDHDNGEGQEHGHGKGKDKDDGGEDAQASPYFREQDYSYLSRYYSGPRDLPPGLRKKYRRSGTLPPGWQKRFTQMPPIVVQQLPPLPPNYQRGYLDGYAVVVDPRTRVIVDAVDILNAINRR